MTTPSIGSHKTSYNFSVFETPDDTVIVWLRLVDSNAKAGTCESRKSLINLLKVTPNTENHLVKKVAATMQIAAESAFLNLDQLQICVDSALRSLNQRVLRSPEAERSQTPAFFSASPPPPESP